MENQQERPIAVDLAWLAGAWEADGSFQLNKCNIRKKKTYISYAPSMGFTNTDLDFIGEVIRILQRVGLAYHQYNRVQMGMGTRIKVDLRIEGIKRTKRAIDLLLPYLKSSKRRKAKAILDYCNLRLSKPKASPYGEIEHKLYLLAESSTTNTLNTEG